MNCPFCRKVIVENSEFCPYCGNNIQQNKAITQAPLRNNLTGSQKQKKNSNYKLIIVIILIIIAILIGVWHMNKKKEIEKVTIDQGEQQEENKKPNVEGTLDKNINTEYDENGAFLMSIEDTVFVTGRGVIVTGKIERGTIKVGDEVQILGLNKKIKTTKVIGIEQFREVLDSAKIGDNVGIILEEIKQDEVERGQTLSEPNTIIATTKFEANAHILSKEEGGRHTPFFNNYKPQFYFHKNDITGTITLPDEIEKVNPGDDVKMTVELELNTAIEVDMDFSIREGGRTIGTGTITKVVE